MILIAALLTVVVQYCDSPSQPDMNECLLGRFNQADARLNAQWKVTLKAALTVSAASANRLRAAQRAWIAYRDANCDAKHYFELGISLDKGLNTICRTDMTLARTKELAEIAQEY